LTDGAAVIELQGVSMAFAKPSGELLQVLSDIDITLREGEILGLLGRSGSGKSTLLRIAAGLIKPTTGRALYLGTPLTGPAEGIAVVFQTFALFPWLTVLENVEASLNPLGLPPAEIRGRAVVAIDQIGLSGFESAFPRELSGGMRQRVGFARALVIAPIVLLMDEPFSALDVLTAEKLRTDFLDLWTTHELPTKSVLMVTHNIEEAAQICDRIIVLSARPGRVAAEIPVKLAHPRNRLDAEFRSIVDEIYSILTSRMVESITTAGAQNGSVQPLTHVSIRAIGALVEKLASPEYAGTAELAKIAPPLAHGDPILAIAEALHVLDLAELKDGALVLTAGGRTFAQSSEENRRALFKEHLVHFVPLAAHIRNVLDERAAHEAPRIRFESELEDHLAHADALETLKTITAWGRYAGLFQYDDRRRVFRLPET
jgi:NitT/TauT family transport system ATP-binding protein